ncbi:zinc ABC transporter substrate-binding protein [Sneathiella marina]|uniref:High-affinity zinc uptake system protein ZnuA n=1 Tax=Sneathiella marina TaxID=2950108 RepID=A0ABY4WCX5_9PROT|nr:zinc ABC transporter substrate-binding protein [Sneathiella marina]USG63109.1 zinc ABC transporter substrate-binding protein [Sneathiella marina]
MKTPSKTADIENFLAGKLKEEGDSMKKILLAIGFALFSSMQTYAAPTSNIVVTIAPLHSLVQGVMGETGEAELLVKGYASPHDFQLKPSQIASLQQADFVFYVGENLETFLLSALETLPEGTEKVALAKQPGVSALDVREGGNWEGHDHSAHGSHKDGTHDHEESVDPHIWLDPANAIAMVKVITRELSKAHPENRSLYKANALAVISDIELRDKEIKALLQPVQAVPFVVFHDAFQYFEKHYDLTAVGSIVIDPTESASVKRLAALRQKVVEVGAVCIFREPQFSDRLSVVVAEGTKAKLATIDPMGAALPLGAGFYPTLLEEIAEGMASCLGK